MLVVGPGFYEQARVRRRKPPGRRAIRARLPAALGELAELAYNAAGLVARLRRACRRFRPDLIYERYNLYYLAGTLAGAAQRHAAVPGGQRAARRGTQPRFGELRPARAGAVGWSASSGARRDRVLAVTGVLKAMIAAAGVPPERIEVVPNGIDPARFAALPARPAAPDPVVLGFVGFVRDWHGLDAVIAAMAADAATPRLDLVVVGDGPARAGAASSRRRRWALPIACTSPGWSPHDAIPGLVAGFDIALQPRVVAYASPLKLFDYMAAGRAIVAPDQPNIREILPDGETALLFDPAASDTMWTAIRCARGGPGSARAPRRRRVRGNRATGLHMAGECRTRGDLGRCSDAKRMIVVSLRQSLAPHLSGCAMARPKTSGLTVWCPARSCMLDWRRGGRLSRTATLGRPYGRCSGWAFAGQRRHARRKRRRARTTLYPAAW